MIKFDLSILYQIINFLVLVWLLNRILYRPIRDILKKRAEKITGLEQGIDQAKNGAVEKVKAFDEGIRTARAKGMKAREELIAQAEDEEKRVIEELNKKAQAQMAETRKNIAKDVDKARASLLGEVDAFSNAITQKILGRAIQ
jgi:F-type H+-transporting ATPase subunit b